MKRLNIRLSSRAMVVICTALLLVSEKPAHAAGSQMLHGHVPRAVTRFGLHPLHRMEGTNRLQLAISLPLRDKEGLTNLFQQIYDPASPSYRHYLTAPQFAERFGPAVADYETLRTFAESNHLSVTSTHPNRTLLDVNGTVADIERAFHIKMQVYQHPTANRTFYAPDGDPSVDLSMPVLHVTGLDNAVLPFTKHRQNKTPHSGGTPRGTGSGPLGNFQGFDFRDAYVPGVSLTGTGQSVALFELDGYFASDVVAYEGQTGLPSVPLINVLLNGFNGTPLSSDGDGECTLDIDMAIAMAPGISGVYVYQGFIPEDILNRIATDNLSKQISCSWGWEPFSPLTDQTFQQFAMQGQSFFDASGDDGAEITADEIVPPSDDPYITQVGGTTLTTSGPLGGWISETVWSWFSIGSDAAGSGGISFTYPIPSWQLGISMAGNGGSTAFRNYPDVALTADNIFIIADQGQAQPFTGGTSCAAPLWAGFTALVNQQGAAAGLPPVGFLNPAIYTLAKGSGYASTFHDITTGNDTNFNSPSLFFATAGYDLCTGWGTPAGSNLINALAPVASTPVLTVATNFISGGNGNGIIDVDECNNLDLLLTNQSAVAATGVQVTISSTTTGAIVAQGTSSYPSIPGHGSALNVNLFTLSTQPTFICGTPIDLTVVVKTDQVTMTNFIVLSSGFVFPNAVSFTNANAATVPTNLVPLFSPLLVSNLQAVGKLTVSVNLTSQFDVGMVLELIAPNGTNVILTQNNGGLGPDYGTGCSSNLETIFDDAAPISISGGAPPYVGTFAPQAPLSAFHLLNGTNLNGVWQLQVMNNFGGTTATLNCWSLNVYPEVCLDGGGECTGSDLSLTMSAAPNPVFQGSNLVYTLTVSNAGPGTASGVLIAQTLPPGVTFVAETGFPATVSQAGTNLNLTLGSIPAYGTAVVSVVTVPSIAEIAVSTATVASQEPDNNPLNNIASVTVLVTEPTADVGVTMTGSPANLLQGGLLTYTIHVTNNGPFTAKSVALSTTLPANANFISAVTSQGTVSFNGTVAALGDIGPSTNVTVTIVVSPTTTGNLIAGTTVSISPLEVDPITFNNSATVSTTVGPAADLAITAIATPSPVVAGSNLSYVITVTNRGPSAAGSIQFSQTLPAGSTFVSSTVTNSVANSGNINAVLAGLASGTGFTFTNIITSPTLQFGVQSQLMISTLSINAQPGDPTPADETITVQTLAEPPTITIVPAGATIISGSSNGAVGVNGSYQVKFFLQNVGTIPTTSLFATLQASNGITVPVPAGPQSYGVLQPGAAPTGEQYSFVASGTNGGVITANFQLTDGSSNIGTANFTFFMPSLLKFSNTNQISVPAPQFVPQPGSGPGSLYPSSIVVSNVPASNTFISVTISNMTHTDPADVGMLLIGPGGQSCVLMSGAGAVAMTTPVTFSFDQNAGQVVPEFGQIVSSSYRPADYNPNDAYTNSPIPKGPYNTNLGVFANISANGTWSLYVYDEANEDTGVISNGWSLNFTTIIPVNQVADLSVGIVSSSSQVVLGNVISNVWTITNNGPNGATVFVTNVLSSGLTLVSNILPAGTIVVQSGATSIYNFGILAAKSGVGVTNFVMATASGFQTNLVSAGSSVLDNNSANNLASVVVTVTPPPADLAVGPIGIFPSPAVINNPNLVYTLYVTNTGPSNAFNVVGVFTNSTSVHITSALSSQGSCSINAGSVQCNLGTIASNQFALVTLTATPVATGTFSNSWSVTTSCNDTNLANNSTTAQVSVTLPIAIITNGAMALISQGAAPFNGAINSGQVNTVSFGLINMGSGATTNLVATLLAASGITPTTSTASYGALAAGGSAAQPFTFTANGSSGSIVKASFSLRDGSNTNFSVVSFNFMIPFTQSYTNSGAIVIPDVGPAVPYPSVIQVSNMTNGPTNLLLTKVTVTLNGFTHSFPHDVEVILVDPAGQEVVLMEHTGGAFTVSNLVFGFDDSASQELATNRTLTSGTYLASQFAPLDSFPELNPVPTASTNLAYFNGTAGNGAWSLYVYDDSSGNNGLIASGWTLGLTAVNPVNPAARLVVSSIEAPSPAVSGDYVYYQITVSNAGPNIATGVFLTNVIPPGTALGPSSVSLSQGTFSVNSSAVICNLGTLGVGAQAVATIQILAGASGTITNTAVAASANTDLYLPDATSIFTVPVFGNAAPFLSAASMTGGGFQLTIDGVPGQSYSVQVSADLIHWTTVLTNTGTFNYVDTGTNAPARFYRAIQQAQ